jgi:hypothetical protein
VGRALGTNGAPIGNQNATPVWARKDDAIKPDNVSVDSFGNSKAYTLARLDRDRPELAERVRAGELSANAAAIEAGFRRKRTPLELLRKAALRGDPGRPTFAELRDSNSDNIRNTVSQVGGSSRIAVGDRSTRSPTSARSASHTDSATRLRSSTRSRARRTGPRWAGRSERTVETASRKR